jgi:hypothetical protein
MSIQTQRNYAAIVALLALAFGAVMALQPDQKLAEATGTRTMSALEQSHTFATKGGGSAQNALVASFASDVSSDYEVRVWIYQTPLLGSETELANGVAWQDANGLALLQMAIPKVRLSSGANIRVVWKTYNDLGAMESNQQQSITLN